MQQSILLIAGNYYPELTGIGRYNAEMIDWLADNGFKCTVISTYPYYPYWKIQPPYEKKNKWYKKEKRLTKNGNEITVYRCPHIVPQVPTGKKRILFDFSFFVSVFFKIITLTGRKFDYVMNVTPPLPLGIVASLYKKITGAKFLYHIQDLQVDAARDLNMISSETLIDTLFRVERFILKRADVASTISAGMKKKVMAKTNKPVILFPNWSDTNAFYPLPNKNELKEVFGLKKNIPVILYSGAIGEKQGLEAILDTAKDFQDEGINAQFVICGSGHYKTVLQHNAELTGLKNITFFELQPNEKLNMFLNMADVHLVIQKAGASDLVMPSKLTNILSVGGLALITANAGSGLYDVIDKYNMGILCKAEDNAGLKLAIRKAITNDNGVFKNNARKYAEEFLSINKIMKRYVEEAMS